LTRKGSRYQVVCGWIACQSAVKGSDGTVGGFWSFMGVLASASLARNRTLFVSKLTNSGESGHNTNKTQAIALPASYHSSAEMSSIELDHSNSNLHANSQSEPMELSLEDLQDVAGGIAPALYFLGSFLAGTASGVTANIIYNSFFSSPSQASTANPGSATATASCQCMAPPMAPVIQITNCTL
jgi:hypothetical protein